MTYTNATRTRLFSHSLTHFFSQRILYRLVLVRRAWSDGPCSALALHYICPPPHQLAPHFVLAASFLDLPEACPACCCWAALPPRRRRRRRRCRRRAAAARRSRYLFVTLSCSAADPPPLRRCHRRRRCHCRIFHIRTVTVTNTMPCVPLYDPKEESMTVQQSRPNNTVPILNERILRAGHVYTF